MSNQQKLDVFHKTVRSVSSMGKSIHGEMIIKHASTNYAPEQTSIKKLPSLPHEKKRSCVVISAGPSVHEHGHIQQLAESDYQGTIIAVDGSYLACLKAGLFPDFVLSLDPHPTRIVRWFGDPNFEKNTLNDDYFARQDLDRDFRENSLAQNKKHIALVDEHASKSTAIFSSTVAPNVTRRATDAGLPIFWWNPLVDSPHSPDSLTKKLYKINRYPCMNTGGTVGSAAWVFAASILNIPEIAVLGMDLGYYETTPIQETQTFYELIKHFGEDMEALQSCFVEFTFPLTGKKFYTDPTYFWYRKNLLELFRQSQATTYNCTEGGTLVDETVECTYFSDFLASHV